MPLFGTIKELLGTKNPRLDLSLQRPGQVTKDAEYRNVRTEHVTEWHDFTYENIKAAYGDLFHLGPFESPAVNLKDTDARVEREDHVDVVASLWCMQVCGVSIREGADVVQRALGLPRLRVSSKPKGMTSKDLINGEKTRIPDWCIFLNLEDPPTEQRTALVWGDDKCSSKWSSDLARCRPESNYIWPFRQMLTYCVNNNTRYGFIFTPEELVALRVYCSRDPKGTLLWHIQHKAVSWNAFGNELTVNMAIWAIAMMSVNEGYRGIMPIKWTLPLNVWWKDIDRQGPYYEHHLSGRRIRNSPPPPGADVRSRPSTIPPAEPTESKPVKRQRKSSRR